MRRLIFRREHQRDLKVRAKVRRRQHLFQRKIFDAHHLHRPRHITQPRTRQFVRSRPRRQHVRHGIARLEKALSILMQHNVIAISEIIFRRESIRRIPEPCGNKRDRNHGHRRRPVTQSPAQGGDRHNDHQRHRRQHVARQHRSPNQRHRNHVHFHDDEKDHLHRNRNARPFDAVIFKRRQQHRQQHPHRQQPQMQIAEHLPQPQDQSQHESQRIQRGGDVVAKKFRIAENISGPHIVITQTTAPAAESEAEAARMRRASAVGFRISTPSTILAAANH